MASSLLVIGELLSGEEEVGWGMVRGGEMIEATGRDRNLLLIYETNPQSYTIGARGGG